METVPERAPGVVEVLVAAVMLHENVPGVETA